VCVCVCVCVCVLSSHSQLRKRSSRGFSGLFFNGGDKMEFSNSFPALCVPAVFHARAGSTRQLSPTKKLAKYPKSLSEPRPTPISLVCFVGGLEQNFRNAGLGPGGRGRRRLSAGCVHSPVACARVTCAVRVRPCAWRAMHPIRVIILMPGVPVATAPLSPS
jgi:hypothetical protein